MDEKAIALRVLIAAAKAQPENAPALWKAARMVLNGPVAKLNIDSELNKTGEEAGNSVSFPPMKAEFDYLDENGLHTHRTIYVIAMTDGRDVKKNSNVPVADRYGYLLTGYCTLRKQIRSFRSSRISNLRTFVEGGPLQANRQWRERQEAMAV